MELKTIFLLIFLSTSSAFAQKTVIRKAVAISKVEFDTHLPVINLITKPAKNLKIRGVIKFKTIKKTLVLKDDGEFLEYKHEGELKGYPITIIHELEPNSEEYYFINKLTGRVDTLLDKPTFYPDKKHFICLEGAGTDISQRIQVGELQNDQVITRLYIKLSKQPYIPVSYIFWYNKNTVFISDNNTKFYKVSIKSF